MRAAVADLVVETWTDFRQTFATWAPAGTPVAVEDVRVGDRVWLDGLPEIVAKIEPFSGGLRFTFGSGQWHEPYISVASGSSIMPAVPLPIIAANAGYGQLDHVLPMTTIVDSPNLVTVALTDQETSRLQFAPGGPWPWDLYVNTGDGWTRLVEGTLSIVYGYARQPYVEPYGAFEVTV